MKIAEIETTILRLPEVRPIGDGCQTILVVRVKTDEGIDGVGEIHTNPVVSKAVIDAPLASISSCGLRELLIGEDPLNVNRLYELMYRRTMTFGRRGAAIHAISGIEIALWDIRGKALGQPIHVLLGGAIRSHVPAYASVLAASTPAAAARDAESLIERGYGAVKLGWGELGGDVRHDAAIVGEVRKTLGETVDIMLDMGFPIPLADALYLGRALADQNVYFLEEPLSGDDLVGYRRLTDASPTPIATGEKESTRYPFIELMDRGGLQIVQPDVARVGGIAETAAIAIHAEARSVTVIPHCWSSDILVAATLHVLATLKRAPYVEINATDNPLRTSLITEPFGVADGQMTVPTKPGLGIDLNEETVQRFKWEP